MDPDSHEARLRALLEAQHSFPGPYLFKVIFKNEQGLRERLVSDMCRTAGVEAPVGEPSVRSSSGGKFLALTVELELRSSDDVLAIYGELQEREDIISVF